MQDSPVVVQVALLPAKVTEQNRNQQVQGEFMVSSVSRFNNSGKQQTVAEYLKYLVEDACPEVWLLPICRHARSKTNVVKLCYGCGYETTVVIGNADANGTPKNLGLGLSVNTTNATVGQIEGLWMSGTESIWNHVMGQVQRIGQKAGNVCVYIRTGARRFMIPAVPEEQLQKRRRMVRVWPDPDNANFLERMEEVHQPHAVAQMPPPHVARVPAPPSRAPAPAPPSRAPASAATSAPSAASEEAPKKPPAKNDKSTTKKRAASTDDQAEGSQKKRAKKDKDKPTGARTAYHFYLQDHRARVKEANPGVSSKDVVSLRLDEISKQTHAVSLPHSLAIFLSFA